MNEANLKLYTKHLRSKGLSEGTCEAYRSDADLFCNYLDHLSLRLEHVNLAAAQSYIEHLTTDSHATENTVRRKIISLKCFFRFLVQTRIIAEPVIDTMLIPRLYETPIHLKEIEQMERSITSRKQATEAITKSRDDLILSLITNDALKISELCALKLTDLRSSSDRPYELLVGTRKKRIIQLHPKSKDAIFKYLAHRKTFNPDTEKNLKGCFLFSFKGSLDEKKFTPITRHGIKYIIKTLTSEDGKDGLSSEEIRKIAILNMIKNGRSVFEIMDHLGLKNPGIVRIIAREVDANIR